MGRYAMPVFVTMPPQYMRRESRRYSPDPLEDLITNTMYSMPSPYRRDKAEKFACQKRCAPKEHCGTEKGYVPQRTLWPLQSLLRVLLPRQPWLQLIDVSGYGPGDLSVKVNEGKFFVHAKREIKLEGGDYDLMEHRRSVKIPEGVDTSAISCHLRPDGRLIVRAPYVEEEEPSSNHEASGQCCEKEKECKKEEESSEPIFEQNKENMKMEVNTECCEDQGYSESHDGEQKDVLSGHSCETEPEISDKDEVEAKKSVVEDDKNTRQQKSEIGNDEKMKILSQSPVPFDDFCVLEPGHLSNEGEKPENAEVAEIMETSVGPKLFPFTDTIREVETEDKKHFEVKVNLEGSKPDEISVKCVDDELIIDSRRKWEATEGVESVQTFHRRYALPEGAMCNEAKAVLNDNGLMVITVPIVEKETGKAIHVPVKPAEE